MARLVSDRFFGKKEEDPLEESWEEKNKNVSSSNPGNPGNPGNANNSSENEPSEYESKETTVGAFDPTRGDPATLTTPHYPPMYVTVDVDELAELVNFLEGLKAPQLKSQVVKWYFRAQSLQQWAQDVINMWRHAQEKGLKQVKIPAPPVSTPEEAATMQELFKVMAPIAAMKTMLGDQSSLSDAVTALKELQDMADKSKKLVKIKDEELGEIEVPVELAILLRNLRKGESGEKMSDYVQIKDAEGNVKTIPKDLYMIELAKEMAREFSRSRQPESPAVEDSRLSAKLLSTIENLSNSLQVVLKEVNALKEKMSKGFLGELNEYLDAIVQLNEKLDRLRGTQAAGSGNKAEELKWKVLEKAIKGEESETKEEPAELDATMQRARQEAEKLLREIEAEEAEEEKKKPEIVEVKE